MKTCFKCGESKPLTEFYKHPQMADGHLGKCKTCAKVDVSGNYKTRKPQYQAYERERFQQPGRKKKVLEYQQNRRRNNPEKAKAWNMVSNAVRSGKLIRQPCESCNVPKAQAHHEDYSKPLDVRWLCFVCHRAEHGQEVLVSEPCPGN